MAAASNRPAWANYLYDEQDKDKRKNNWDTHHLTKAQLTEWGPNAINFYFAFIRHNHEAIALLEASPYNKGFKLIKTLWYLISEVENGGWAQYFWNSASTLKSFDEKVLFKPTLDCLEKLYTQFPVGADLQRSATSALKGSGTEVNLWGSEDSDPVPLMKKALAAYDKKLLLKKLTEAMKAKTEDGHIRAFQQYLDQDALEELDKPFWQLQSMLFKRLNEYILSNLDEFCKE